MLTVFFLGFLTVAAQTGGEPPVTASSASIIDAGTVAMSSSASLVASAPLPFDPKKGIENSNASKVVTAFKNAAEDRQWFYAAGLLLFLLVFLARTVVLPIMGVTDPAQYDKWLPRISVVLSAAPTIATILVDPDFDIVELVTTSVGCFVMANGVFKLSKNAVKNIPSVQLKPAPLPVVLTAPVDVKPDAPADLKSDAPVEPKKEN